MLEFNVAGQSLEGTLFESVSRDATSIWTYKDTFPNVDSLIFDQKCFEKGIAVDGNKTRGSIIRMIKSAMSKKNVNMFVLGGSSTIGADLGSNNLRLTYHYALADWWNKTVGSITGSYMHRKVVAVGGVGTTYFGHCWQEYVNDSESFDYITWEFAINDPDSLQYEKAVERFTRDILSMTSSPGLTFVNFARKNSLTSNSAQTCKRHDEEAKVIDKFAKHYSTTSVRWERSICACKKFKSKKMLEKLFTNNHPREIGHAQVSYMLISYFKKVILEYLIGNKKSPSITKYAGSAIKRTVPAYQNYLYQNNGIPSLLPEPIYMAKNEWNNESKCHTSITPGPAMPPKHSLRSLKVLENRGFTIIKESPWDSVPEERFDSTGGYVTEDSGNVLKLQLEVSKGTNPFSQISVTVRNKYFGGKVKMVLDELTPNKKIVHADTSEKKKAGTNTIELGHVSHGSHTLSVYTETGGCNICALIID